VEQDIDILPVMLRRAGRLPWSDGLHVLQFGLRRFESVQEFNSDNFGFEPLVLRDHLRRLLGYHHKVMPAPVEECSSGLL
jgi:hypothetical protein